MEGEERGIAAFTEDHRHRDGVSVVFCRTCVGCVSRCAAGRIKKLVFSFQSSLRRHVGAAVLHSLRARHTASRASIAAVSFLEIACLFASLIAELSGSRTLESPEIREKRTNASYILWSYVRRTTLLRRRSQDEIRPMILPWRKDRVKCYGFYGKPGGGTLEICRRA